ncbi:MAG: single-stranded DNA-binding protein, partial [Gammaproteobacteria bacterium]
SRRVKGIHCALQGRLGQDVELRRSERGKDWCRLSVGVGEGDEVTWVSVSVFEEKARALVGLAKGAGVYVEGRLSLNTWTGKDCQPRTGLSVSAWRVEALGRIGKRRPAKAPKHAEEFDDALTFRSRGRARGRLDDCATSGAGRSGRVRSAAQGHLRPRPELRCALRRGLDHGIHPLGRPGEAGEPRNGRAAQASLAQDRPRDHTSQLADNKAMVKAVQATKIYTRARVFVSRVITVPV